MVGAGPVIGREGERETLEAFIVAGPRPGALVLEGVAGIGKTTLWRQALDTAAQRGEKVLSCRPAAGEAALAFAGLSDLLDGVMAELGDVPLPAPQRHALEVALLLTEADAQPPDVRLLASSLVTVLRALSRRTPVLVAIDDIQWLDRESAEVVRFAVRRLGDERIGLLVAQRGDGHGQLPLGLDQAMSPDRLARLTLGPLTSGALHHLLSTRLGIAFSRPALRRLHDSCGGNPLYGIELAAAVMRRGVPLRADDPLPVPPSLEGLMQERLEALPPEVRSMLALVATLLDPRLETVQRLADESGLSGAIDAGLSAGVLELSAGRLGFSHPLLRVAVTAKSGPEERRALHRRLAEVTGNEERAIHLALCTDSPDAAIAQQLADAADAAAARGASDAAARLSEHATRLTPQAQADTAARRALITAIRYTAAGDPTAARSVLERTIEALPSGPLRGEALSQLAWVNLEEVDLGFATQLLEQALEEASGEPAISGEVRVRLAILEGIRGHAARAEEHGRAAIEDAERIGDQRLLARALTQAAYRRTVRGGGVGEEARRAVEIERGLSEFMGAYSPSICLGQVLMYDDQLDEARPVLQAVLRRASDAGDEEARAQILFHLGDLERRAGNLIAAGPPAREASELWRQGGNEQEFGSSLCLVAGLDALAGRLSQARDTAQRGLEIAERIGDQIFAIHHRGVLGLIELTDGDPVRAQQWLAPATDALIAQNVAELSIYPVVQYELEALAAIDRLDRLEELVQRLEAVAKATGRSWTTATAARGRALLLAATGDLSRAHDSLSVALAAHERSPQPFERARTLLILGVVERRAKQRRAAREALTQSLAQFAALPSPPWEARARNELARVGLRRAPEHLTRTEARIAELAAQGMSNREIAAAAFVSRKTVEANLTKVYRKLGVRSRTELARRFSLQADQP